MSGSASAPQGSGSGSAAAIFAAVSCAHLVRLVAGFEASIAGHALPGWLSAVAVVVAGTGTLPVAGRHQYLRPFTGGLGLLAPSYCPHYDSEPGRRPLYQSLIAAGSLPAGIACDDGAAAHFVDDTLVAIVADAPGPRGYSVGQAADGTAAEIVLETQVLQAVSAGTVAG